MTKCLSCNIPVEKRNGLHLRAGGREPPEEATSQGFDCTKLIWGQQDRSNLQPAPFQSGPLAILALGRSIPRPRTLQLDTKLINHMRRFTKQWTTHSLPPPPSPHTYMFLPHGRQRQFHGQTHIDQWFNTLTSADFDEAERDGIQPPTSKLMNPKHTRVGWKGAISGGNVLPFARSHSAIWFIFQGC